MTKPLKKQPKKEPVVKAGVGVIVVKGNEFLVGKRKGSHGAGLWAFPGGHLEPSDSSFESCCEREVFEETGMACKVFSPDHYRQELFTTFDILSEDKQKIYVTSYFVADHLHGIPKVMEPDKCEEWFWKDLDWLTQFIGSENQRTWIPVDKVIYYLKDMWEM